ncbi:uncharacterized protein Z518_06473 [Rhinocladiella mackenziei CBS 650.93]|uniref:Rhinocladiella mackenziei CBS 650.93 unplaced genomic scaffold supercont1.4, whole genome shotgun sequence n=1 Tax=Rhinocladiella mackenziei CBS 650.93 TaxID=1442369 RepID=A0A0D2IR14_9EURO|nr:uncharacterized protein Z518_06473 [Rhinocladiella mackenziei CBS 650.93]KIX05601.1 hypothetical protein Z518_06473 [Rhinocladiella mackenziei CBS 650.93]
MKEIRCRNTLRSLMAPRVELPSGDAIVKVAFICNATISGIPWSRFTMPSIRGLEVLDKVPSFSFFIEHPSGRRVLFDLGVRRDWWNLSPVLARRMKVGGWKTDVSTDVSEILEEHHVPLQSIDTVIWSHWHWDHIGDMSKFPAGTNLLTGPGFVEAFIPGYPANENSPIQESDYSGRTLIEIEEFERQIGDIPAHDFFGDGSFYLLWTPGHAIGHLSALARTSTARNGEDDTFILMGGDCCHHMGQMRPCTRWQLPYDIKLHVSSKSPASSQPGVGWNMTSYSRGSDVALLEISDYANGESAAINPEEAVNSLRKLMSFDDERVLVAIAHDKTLHGVVDLFPKPANNWKVEGWADRARWAFLNDFGEKE